MIAICARSVVSVGASSQIDPKQKMLLMLIYRSNSKNELNSLVIKTIYNKNRIRFPPQPGKSAKWTQIITAINMQSLNPTIRTRICSTHFVVSAFFNFDEATHRKKLRKDAIPTIFPFRRKVSEETNNC